MWDSDGTDILVQCWAEVQRRYKIQGTNTEGNRIMEGDYRKVNVLVSVDRKPSQVESKMRKISEAYKEVKIKTRKAAGIQ